MPDTAVIEARTALVIPFHRLDNTAPATVAERLLGRALVRRRDKPDGKVWESIHPTPSNANELGEHVLAALGAVVAPTPEAGRWLQLTNDARQLIMSNLALLAPDANADTVPTTAPELEADAVRMVLLPAGGGALVLQLNWGKHPAGRSWLLGEVRELVYRTRHTNVESRGPGWQLAAPRKLPAGQPPATDREAFVVFLGTLRAAVVDAQPVSLGEFARWLLLDAQGTSVGEIGTTRYLHAHTAVVLSEPLAADVLHDELFRLRRGYGADYIPPTEPGRDVLLWPRGNRVIGVSREGTACFSWPARGMSNVFEENDWTRRYTGVYLLLLLHVLGERVAIAQLTAEGTRRISYVVQLGQTDHPPSLKIVSQARDALRKIAAQMAHYQVSMAADDCGGLTNYVDFFQACRTVHAIRSQREALRDQVTEVLALAESQYQEIEEHERRKAAADAERERDAASDHRAAEDRRERRFHVMVAVLAGFTVPFSVLSGLMGMNVGQEHMPSASFYSLLGAATAVGAMVAIMLIAVVLRPVRRRPPP